MFGTDGTTTLSPSAVQSGTYDFAAIYNLNNAAAGSGPVVAGVITPTDFVPTEGTTAYAGEAFVDGTNITTGAFSTKGSSTVNVNFETGVVDVEISGFTTPPDFDTLQTSGMMFDADRNTFSGGSFVLLKNGTVVTSGVLGTDITSEAAGSLFGLNASETLPDEVGGVFVADGTDGTISGGYIAD